jgi:tetratricopeptide (TPR) repeat protein
MRRLIPVGAGLLFALAANAAEAQPTDSVAAAEQLFEQARALFDQGNFAEACPRFDASYKLDPALGTLLNMSTCYEMLGHIASAWGHYREVLAHATKAGDQPRMDIAKARIAALEPRLPKLTIKGPKAPIGGMQLTRDDAPIDVAVLGASIYVDPGSHTIAASAPGYKSFTKTIEIKEGESQDVQIALELAPDQPKPMTGGVTIIREQEDPGHNRRLIGLTLGAGGVAGVITGVAFGVAARDSWNNAFDDNLCNKATKECTAEGQDLAHTARTRALIANIVGGAGIAMLAGGVILYFTAPSRADVGVTPTQGGAAVTFGGHW